MGTNEIILVHMLGLGLGVYAIGILFIYRSSPFISNKRRNAAGHSLKAFLDALAKLSVINALVFGFEVSGIESPMLEGLARFLTVTYLGGMLVVTVLFVLVGDFLSKVLLWTRWRTRRSR